MMCWFILVSIIIIAFSRAQTCINTCSYIYDNRDGSKTTNELYLNLSMTNFTTGVYTVKGQFSCTTTGTTDHLRFRKMAPGGTVVEYQPLVMRVYGTEAKAEFYAEVWNTDTTTTVEGLQTLNDWKDSTEMSLQISDHLQDRYAIYLNSYYIDFNYANNWDSYINRRFNTINSIYSDLDCIKYNYIMVCDDLKLNMCDVSQPSGDLVLGKSYSLGCGGTGSPVLEIKWTVRYGFGGNKDALRSSAKTASVGTDGDDVVKSKFEITKFSIYDIGQYNCTVTNKNYKNTTSHTFTLSYTQQVNRTISSSPKFYKTSNLPLNFTWTIRGWPLDKIKANCTSNGSYSQDLFSNKTRIENYLLLNLTFQWNIKSPTNATHIFCTITNSGTEIYSNTITRVGYRCAAGWYGEGDACIPCPDGMVSPAEAFERNQCYRVTSLCLAGMYGVEKDCTECPPGKTSEDFAVKIEECFETGSNLGVIIGGSVGGIVLIIIAIIGLFCFLRKKRGGIGKEKETDIHLNHNINMNANGSNPVSEQDPEPQYAENTVTDPDSALYAQVDRSSRYRKTPQDESIYSDVEKVNETYAELDRSTTKRKARAPEQRVPETIYSCTIQDNMVDTTYSEVERNTAGRDGRGRGGRRGGGRREEEETTYSSIQNEIEKDEDLYSEISDVI